MKHLPQLDGLRALALLMVFVHHAFRVPFLWSGVDMFFILSGYLITNILLRDSARMGFGAMLRQFYIRRAQRILPAYLLCLAAIALLAHVDWAHLWPFYAFFLQNIPVALQLMPFGPLVPLWSLAVEQHFYLVWPILVFFVPRRALGPVLVAILLVVPVLRWTLTPHFASSDAMYSLTPFRIDTMAAGALLALWLPHIHRTTAIRCGQAAFLLGILALALLRPEPWFNRSVNSPQFNSLAYSINILLFGGLFTWVALLETGWLRSALSWQPLRFLGQISYSFYLLHLLVLLEVGNHMPQGRPGSVEPVVLDAALAFIITGVLATLSWRLIEQPILHLRLTSAPPPGRAVPNTPAEP